jgi:hypothetical protein
MFTVTLHRPKQQQQGCPILCQKLLLKILPKRNKMLGDKVALKELEEETFN